MPTTCTPTTCSFARRELVARELEQIAPSCVWGETIARLCCLRAINTLTALGLCAEIGDWKRFEHPDSIAKYVGLVPSEHSSGQTRRLGKITKAGSTHARRLLVKAAFTTASRLRSVASSRSANATKTQPSSITPGASSAGCTRAASCYAKAAASPPA
jgi:transposase